MKRFLSKFKAIICVIVAVLIGVLSFPIASNIAVNAEEQESYIIFEADSDKTETKKDGVLTASILSGSNKYATLKKYDELGSYFSTDFSIEGNGGESSNAVFKTGLSSNKAGFGWLADKTFLNKISKFFKVEFDYRVTSDSEIPSDALLTMAAAYSTDVNVCTFGSVSAANAETWQKASFSVSDGFTLLWQDGFINIYLSSANGAFAGVQTVDIRRIRISVNEEDRLDFNKALKLARFKNIENFTKDVELKKDSDNNNDIFAVIISKDGDFYSSKSSDNSYKLVNVKDNGGAMVTLSQNRVKVGEKVDILISLNPKLEIATLDVKTTSGTSVEVSTGAINKRYSFTMPSDDVYISIATAQLSKVPMALLWYCEPGTQPYDPYYSGTSTRPYAFSKIHDVDVGTYTYNCEVTATNGWIDIYGRGNTSYTIDDFYDTAYVTIKLKYTTESENRILKIGSKESGPVKEITVEDGWVEIGAYYKDLTTSTDFSWFTLDLRNLNVGDIIRISNVCIWSDKPKDSFDGFDQIRDISHYEKKDTNVKMFEVGDTTAAINPWNNPNGQANCPIHFDRAWHTIFQNMYSWDIYNQEDIPSQKYSLEFYANGKDTAEWKNGAENFRDTGYIEFFVKSNIDGFVLPLNVIAPGSVTLPIHIRYDKAQAREDGWMRVRIPFTYLSDFGMDINKIQRISIIGTEPLKESVFLSSFRFYTNYADNPDPPLIEEEEKPEERELPIELDSSIINAVLDKENLILYIPDNTHIWEILSAITFDTDESYAWFLDKTTGKIVEDEEIVLNDNFDMMLYRRDFYLNSFLIQYIKTETEVKIENEPSEEIDDSEEIIDSEGTTDYDDFMDFDEPMVFDESEDSEETEDLEETITQEETTDLDENIDSKKPAVSKKPTKSNDSEGSNVTTIIVIVISAVAVLAIACVGIIYFKKIKKGKN